MIELKSDKKSIEHVSAVNLFFRYVKLSGLINRKCNVFETLVNNEKVVVVMNLAVIHIIAVICTHSSCVVYIYIHKSVRSKPVDIS